MLKRQAALSFPGGQDFDTPLQEGLYQELAQQAIGTGNKNGLGFTGFAMGFTGHASGFTGLAMGFTGIYIHGAV
jgi:hypothetical protein